MFEVKLLQPECDFVSRHPIARLEILDGNYREFWDIADKEKVFDVEIKRHREKRSLNANAYFHVLCDKIAEKIGASKAEVKNLMMIRYGQAQRLPDGSLMTVTIRTDADVSNFEHLHLRPTSEVEEKDGKLYRTYIVIRGSGWKGKEGYDTNEMALLIKGAISEAREVGIPDAEIMSPREYAMLKELYGVR